MDNKTIEESKGEKAVEEDKDVKETLKTLMSEIKSLRKDNDILMQSADKRALARYYAKNKGAMPSIVGLRTVGGKLVIGWKMIEDRGSYQIPGTGKWTEYQMLQVFYKDGTSEKMTEEEFERRYEKVVKAKRIAIVKDDETGFESLKLSRMDTGEELTIGVQFVN